MIYQDGGGGTCAIQLHVNVETDNIGDSGYSHVGLPFEDDVWRGSRQCGYAATVSRKRRTQRERLSELLKLMV